MTEALPLLFAGVGSVWSPVTLAESVSVPAAVGVTTMVAVKVFPEGIDGQVQVTVEVPVQVNGTLRSRVVVVPDISEEDLRTIALADAKLQSFIDGHQIVKVIVVPQRLVNVVVK